MPLIHDLRVSWVSPKLPPEVVAPATLRGKHHRRSEVIVPRADLALIYLNTVAPRRAEGFVRFFHLQRWK